MMLRLLVPLLFAYARCTTVVGTTPDNTSRKHLRTKVTPDFHLTYSKNGGNLGRIKMIKNDNFQYKSIESYVVAILIYIHDM